MPASGDAAVAAEVSAVNVVTWLAVGVVLKPLQADAIPLTQATVGVVVAELVLVPLAGHRRQQPDGLSQIRDI